MLISEERQLRAGGCVCGEHILKFLVTGGDFIHFILKKLKSSWTEQLSGAAAHLKEICESEGGEKSGVEDVLDDNGCLSDNGLEA